MNLTQHCLTCLHNQACKTLALFDMECKVDFIPTSTTTTLACPPPKLAIEIYKQIAQRIHNQDPYAKIKKQSIITARQILSSIPFVNDLEWGVKMAVLGNVIDYGSQKPFDIHTFGAKFCEFDIDMIDFGVFDFETFKERLGQAKKLVYIGDNAGENEFDEVLIRVIKHFYPHLTITYFTRGKPIINDITLDDLAQTDSKLFTICEVLDSGVESPGFLYDLANTQARKSYDEADLILAKGMGNFECLEDKKDERLFLLFKIKCQVVADFLGEAEGKFMFLHNSP